MRNAFIVIFLAGVLSAQADPPLSKTVDFSGSTAPALQFYQANTRTVEWSYKNNGAAVNGAGYSAFMWIAPSNSSPSVVTAACSWVTQTSGIMRAVFSPSDLNTNGYWVYGVGLTSNNNTTARQGALSIVADPYSSASALTLTSAINWSLFTYLNTTNGPYLAGSNISFRTAGTNGQVYIDGGAGGGGGVTDHAALTSLDYASAGHTGFQPAGSYLTAEQDTNALAQIGSHTLLSTNAHGGIATSAQGVLADTALQAEVDPTFVAWTNGINIQAGLGASADQDGVAIGYNAYGSDHGAALGNSAYGYVYGAALGYDAKGYDHGAALGNSAYGESYGVAIGQSAIGRGAGNVAIGSSAIANPSPWTNTYTYTAEIGTGTATNNGWLHYRGKAVIDGSGLIPASIINGTVASATYATTAGTAVTSTGLVGFVTSTILTNNQTGVTLGGTFTGTISKQASATNADLATTAVTASNLVVTGNLNMGGYQPTNFLTAYTPTSLSGVSNMITLGGNVNYYSWILTNTSTLYLTPCASNVGASARVDIQKNGQTFTINSGNCITSGLGNVSLLTNVGNMVQSYLFDQAIMDTNVLKVGGYQLR